MSINTKFNIGDTVFTIDSDGLRLKTFVVGTISTWTDKSKTRVLLYAEDNSAESYYEDVCFPTEAELKNHVFGNS